MTTIRVGNRLRAVLADRHWSQQDLADLSGLPYATVRRLVRGGGNPPLDLALAICGALGVEIEDVYWLDEAGECARPETETGKRERGARTRD